MLNLPEFRGLRAGERLSALGTRGRQEATFGKKIDTKLAQWELTGRVKHRAGYCVADALAAVRVKELPARQVAGADGRLSLERDADQGVLPARVQETVFR
jgi:hypothetical protein